LVNRPKHHHRQINPDQAAFGVYAALGYSLTAAVAFPSLALLNLLRFPIVMIPMQVGLLLYMAITYYSRLGGRICGFRLMVELQLGSNHSANQTIQSHLSKRTGDEPHRSRGRRHPHPKVFGG
jgi:hypothetical protein